LYLRTRCRAPSHAPFPPQEEFARTYAIPIHTLRKWEQKIRRPDQASRVYLTTISRDPKAIKRLVAMT